MFKKNINNSRDIKTYIRFVKKTIIEPRTKDEIVTEIEKFSTDGIVVIDGNNLSGKILDVDGNLYIDIKFQNGKFICSYTRWDLNSIVTIEQDRLKDEKYKLTKTEKVKYKTPDNENLYRTEIIEKIYSQNYELLYESKTQTEESFTFSNNELLYRDDSPFINTIDIEKMWYIPNGSIIRYSMKKNELHSKKEIEESYLICKKTYKTEFGTTRYFVNLGRELFVELMTGKCSIEDVLAKLDEEEPVKKIMPTKIN